MGDGLKESGTMKTSDVFWKIFELTGSIIAYIMYKNYPLIIDIDK